MHGPLNVKIVKIPRNYWNRLDCVRLEVLALMNIKITFFWRVTPFSLKYKCDNISEKPPRVVYTFLPCRMGQHACSKPWYPLTELHCVTCWTTLILTKEIHLNAKWCYVAVRESTAVLLLKRESRVRICKLIPNILCYFASFKSFTWILNSQLK